MKPYEPKMQITGFAILHHSFLGKKCNDVGYSYRGLKLNIGRAQ